MHCQEDQAEQRTANARRKPEAAATESVSPVAAGGCIVSGNQGKDRIARRGAARQRIQVQTDRRNGDGPMCKTGNAKRKENSWEGARSCTHARPGDGVDTRTKQAV